MQRIASQQSTSNLDQSYLSRKKKAVLIKAFRNNNQTQLISHQSNRINTSSDSNLHEQINPLPRLKTHRDVHERQQEPSFPKKVTSMRVNTEQISLNSKKSKNIFDNEYVNCLKKGFTHAYQEPTKIQVKTKQINDFQGPIYCSEKFTERSQNPQFSNQPIIVQEEVYKFDKNPKLLKFKVSLKRQNFNPTQNQKQLSKLGHQKKHQSRVLITQLHSEQSKLSRMNRSSLRSQQSGQVQMKLQPLRKKHFNPQSYSTQIQPRSQKIPKLSEKSNLFKSIKIFERKQSLLGQIEHHRQLDAKYGQRMFENLVRDKYKQIERKNDYILKVHYGRNNEPKEEKFRNKFISEIQQGKYETKFKYQEKQMPLKLKGRTKTMPRYQTILYED